MTSAAAGSPLRTSADHSHPEPLEPRLRAATLRTAGFHSPDVEPVIRTSWLAEVTEFGWINDGEQADIFPRALNECRLKDTGGPRFRQPVGEATADPHVALSREIRPRVGQIRRHRSRSDSSSPQQTTQAGVAKPALPASAPAAILCVPLPRGNRRGPLPRCGTCPKGD